MTDDNAATAPPRPQRPATVIFTQTTLALQAFAALFAVLAVWGLARAGELEVSSAAVWGLGFGYVALLAYAVGQQGKPRGHAWGWAMQVPMLVAGFVLPAIAVIGVVFLAIWITGLRVGGKIDRERAERIAAEAHGVGAAEAQGVTAPETHGIAAAETHGIAVAETHGIAAAEPTRSSPPETSDGGKA